jgi:hypothetical protein
MITEAAAAALPSTRRKRLGDGMVRPIRALEMKDPHTGWFRLIPGVHQVSIDWWGYRRNPELFMPVNRDDTRTVARHRETLERTRRHIERQLARAGTTRADTRPPRKFSLGPERSPRWRLP